MTTTYGAEAAAMPAITAPASRLSPSGPRSSLGVDPQPGRAGRLSVMHAQPGIFAQGTGEHAYVEFDLRPGAEVSELVTGLAALHGPDLTVAGVNVVVGLRPQLWRSFRRSASWDSISSSISFCCLSHLRSRRCAR